MKAYRRLRIVEHPKTKELLESGHRPAETCFYTCEEEGICDFSDCRKKVEKSVELRAYGCQEIKIFPV